MNKFITLSLLSIFFLTFQSCSEESSTDTSIDKNELLGEWILKDVYSENGAIKFPIQGQTISGTITIKGSNFNNTQKFTENPNKLTSTGGLTLTSTISFLGRNETKTQNVPDETITGDWSVIDNKLTTNVSIYNGVSSTATIKRLTKSSLVLYQNLSKAEQFTGLDNITLKGNLIFIYERK